MKKVETWQFETRVQKRVWDADDTYLVVQVQVPDFDFKEGEKVKVTIEKEE